MGRALRSLGPPEDTETPRGARPFAMSRLVFPAVELVSHIPDVHHPLGRYVRRRHRIELSRKELVHRPAHEREFAVHHEAGHWWRTDRIDDHLVGGDEDEEAFADAFAFYFIEPAQLRPGSCKLIMGTVGPDEAHVRRFLEAATQRLEEEIRHG